MLIFRPTGPAEAEVHPGRPNRNFRGCSAPSHVLRFGCWSILGRTATLLPSRRTIHKARSSVKPHTTELLSAASAGDENARSTLFNEVYAELRRLAAGYMRRQRANHTLQPTALVHEAFLKMVNAQDTDIHGREHFLAVGATAMRQILVSHAREHGAQKRGGGWERVTLDDAVATFQSEGVDLEELGKALQKLARLDERQARIAEMRLFGGLGVEATANVLGIAKTTVKTDWAFARAWLKRELNTT